MIVSAHAPPASPLDVPPCARRRQIAFSRVDGCARARRRSGARCRARRWRDGCRNGSVAGGRQSVTVRKGEVETISYNRDKGVGVTVYVGARRGHASTADFSDDAIRATVDKALAIARYTAEDPCAGLADPDAARARVARSRSLPSVGPCRSRMRSSSAARRKPRRWRSIRASPTAKARASSRGESEFVYANTLGLLRRLSQLAASHRLLGDRRGRRRDAARLLVHGRARARRPATPRRSRPHRRRAHGAPARRAAARHARMPGAVRGARSRRPDRLVRAARCRAAACIASRRSCSIRSGSRCSRRTCNIREEPHLLRARGSAPFDNEGVATKPRDVVRDGVVQGYFLGSYSARKLGHASRPATPAAATTSSSRTATTTCRRCCARMGRGLLVTEQLGQGVNPVTGDYSRGAAGILGRGRRRSRIRSRRSPSPAT